ncbi:MAG: hypothetical protein K6F81_02540 [Acholeplasmatales bacterium]|nr:hypothetical protein [Acholeplasmatales bacterium]
MRRWKELKKYIIIYNNSKGNNFVIPFRRYLERVF